jgi:hypothetical protein
MTTLREAAQQFVADYENGDLGDMKHYARALRAALAQEEQEPVAWVDEASIAWLAEHPRGIITTRLVLQKSPERQMPLYTAPPRREWQRLTDEEIGDVFQAARNAKLGSANDNSRHRLSVVEIARAIEAALKEKNHG